MERLIYKVTVLLVFSAFFMNINAQKKGENLLDPSFASFEDQYTGWFSTSKDHFMISNKKFTKGENSLKFSLKNQNKPVAYKMHYTGKPSSSYSDRLYMKLKPGVYKVDFKLWVGNFMTANKFKIALAGYQKEKYASKQVGINNMEKRKWIDFSTELNIKEVGKYNFIILIQVPKNKRHLESNTFYLYIDDVSLVRL